MNSRRGLDHGPPIRVEKISSASSAWETLTLQQAPDLGDRASSPRAAPGSFRPQALVAVDGRTPFLPASVTAVHQDRSVREIRELPDPSGSVWQPWP